MDSSKISRGAPGTVAREVPPGHVLEGIDARAIAQRIDGDDVAFELLDGTSRVAVVHLTYSKNIDWRWPITQLFKDLATWMVDGMRSDANEYGES